MKAGLFALLLTPVMAAPVTPGPSPEPKAEAASPSDPLDGLVADSPFGAPTGGGAKGTAGATGPLELRSIVFVDGAYQFSIFDQGTNKAEWVKLEEKGFPFVAKSFNRERDALTVEHRGRTVVLALPAAKTAVAANNPPPSGPAPLPGAARPNAASGGAAPNVPSVNATGANAPGPTPAPPSATNAAEAQRLQNLADEIRRRRGSGPITLPKNN
jgi:hypothetical protein